MPLISYDASIGVNKKQKREQQRQKLCQKIALSMSATMTIVVIVAKTSRRRPTQVPPPVTERKAQTRAATTGPPVIIILLFRRKRRMGDVPHKSPGNKALVIRNSDTHKKETFRCFCIYLFLELDVWQHLPQWRQRGLLCHEFWWGTGNCTATCTNSKENVQYKKWEY
jgi:hypothetical protein